MKEALPSLEVADAAGWREWLGKNHLRSEGVWLVFRKGDRAPGALTYDAALEEALALGWIDSLVKRIDDAKYARKFTPRRPGSLWSSRNIRIVERLTREGRMTKRGVEAFSKRTGEVSQMERVTAEGAKMPHDFEDALRRHKRAWASFETLAPSHRKRYLIWILGAKCPETRQRRIAEAVRLIAQGVKDLLK